MTGSPFPVALTLAVLKTLADHHVKAAQARTISEAIGAYPVGTRLPVEIDGRKVGTVSRPAESVLVSVTNPAAFLAWVRATRPEEVVDEPVVRESFTEAVRRSVRAHGGWLNTATGEIETVPGMERKTGNPKVSVELEPDAGDVVMQAWRDGTLSVPAMLAITAEGERND
jgi:hypothetical protein